MAYHSLCVLIFVLQRSACSFSISITNINKLSKFRKVQSISIPNPFGTSQSRINGIEMFLSSQVVVTLLTHMHSPIHLSQGERDGEGQIINANSQILKTKL
jgi:hypothetical protein